MSFFNWLFSGGDDNSSQEAKALAALVLKLKAVGIAISDKDIEPKQLPQHTKKPLTAEEQASLQDALNAVALAAEVYKQIFAKLKLSEKKQENWYSWIRGSKSQKITGIKKLLEESEAILNEYLEKIGATATEVYTGDLEGEAVRDWPDAGFVMNAIVNARAVIEEVLANYLPTIATPGDGDCCASAFVVAALDAGLKHPDRDKIITMLEAQRKYKDEAKQYYPELDDTAFAAFIAEYRAATDPAKIAAFKNKYFNMHSTNYQTTQFLAACARFAIRDHAIQKMQQDPDSEFHEANVLKHVTDEKKARYASLMPDGSTVADLQRDISGDTQVEAFVTKLITKIRGDNNGKLPIDFDVSELELPEFMDDLSAILDKHIKNDDDASLVSEVVYLLLEATITMRYTRESFLEQFKPHAFMNVQHALAYANEQDIRALVVRIRSTGEAKVLHPTGQGLSGDYNAQNLPRVKTTKPCMELVLSGNLEEVDQHWEVLNRPAAVASADSEAEDTELVTVARRRVSTVAYDSSDSRRDSQVYQEAGEAPLKVLESFKDRPATGKSVLKVSRFPDVVPATATVANAADLAAALQQANDALHTPTITTWITALAGDTALDAASAALTQQLQAMRVDPSLIVVFTEYLPQLPSYRTVAEHIENLTAELGKIFIRKINEENVRQQAIEEILSADDVAEYLNENPGYLKDPDVDPEYVQQLIDRIKTYSVIESEIKRLSINLDPVKPLIEKTKRLNELAPAAAELNRVIAAISDLLRKKSFDVDAVKILGRDLVLLFAAIGGVIKFELELAKESKISGKKIERFDNSLQVLKELNAAILAINQAFELCKTDARFQGPDTSLLMTPAELVAANVTGRNIVFDSIAVTTLEELIESVTVNANRLSSNIYSLELESNINALTVAARHKPEKLTLTDTVIHVFPDTEEDMYARVGDWNKHEGVAYSYEVYDPRYDAIAQHVTADPDTPVVVARQPTPPPTTTADQEKIEVLMQELYLIGIPEYLIPVIALIVVHLQESFWQDVTTDLMNFGTDMLTTKTSTWVHKNIDATVAVSQSAKIINMFQRYPTLKDDLWQLFEVATDQNNLDKLHKVVTAAKTQKSGNPVPANELSLDLLVAISDGMNYVEPEPAVETADINEQADPNYAQSQPQQQETGQEQQHSASQVKVSATLTKRLSQGLSIVTRALPRLGESRRSKTASHPGSPPPPPASGEIARPLSPSVIPNSWRSRRMFSSGRVAEDVLGPDAAAPIGIANTIITRPPGTQAIDTAEFMREAGKHFDSTHTEFVGHHHYINSDVALRVNETEPGVHNVYSKELKLNGPMGYDEKLNDQIGIIDTRAANRIYSSYDRQRTYEMTKLHLQTMKECPSKDFFIVPDIKTKEDAEQFVRAFIEVFAPRNANEFAMLSAEDAEGDNAYFDIHANVSIYLPALGTKERKLMQAALYEYLQDAKLDIVTAANSPGIVSGHVARANALLLKAFKEYVGFEHPRNRYAAEPPRSRGVLAGYHWLLHNKLGRSTWEPDKIKHTSNPRGANHRPNLPGGHPPRN